MNFAPLGKNLESACKAYARRTRLEVIAAVELLADEALALPAGSPERKAVVAKIIALESAAA